MILLADAGNSRLKWAFYHAGKRSKQFAQDYSQDSADILLINLLSKNKIEAGHSIIKLILVSVLGADFAKKIQDSCQKLTIELQIICSKAESYGVRNAYIEPSRLGADRFLGMITAHHLVANRHCIIVSCGTAVTIDALTAAGDHLGGLILPGLAQFSNQVIQKASLLKLENTTKIALFANNTADALASGRVYGLVEAINGISSRMEVELLKMNDLRGKSKIMYPVKIILCGGDAKILQPYLNQSTQREDDWLMQGLQLIAEFSTLKSITKPSVVE